MNKSDMHVQAGDAIHDAELRRQLARIEMSLMEIRATLQRIRSQVDHSSIYPDELHVVIQEPQRGDTL